MSTVHPGFFQQMNTMRWKCLSTSRHLINLKQLESAKI